MLSPAGSASKPQKTGSPWSMSAGNQRGLGRAPAVEMQRCWGGVKGEATDGIDGGLTEDDPCERGQRNGEEAKVLLRAGSQATPPTISGGPQFSAHRVVLLSKQHKDGIDFGVGV
jgi:hypothetical protein